MLKKGILLRKAASKIDVSSVLAFDLEAKHINVTYPKGPTSEGDNFPTI